MIEAKALTMRYGPIVALDDVSFKVNKGEVVGLLGPNGAGKSTTMKILTSYLYPSTGTAIVGGYDVTVDPLEVRKRIGYLPEILPLYMDMEVRAYLEFVGRSRGLDNTQLRQRIGLVVEECGLKNMYRRVIRELSKGYKQRTGLAQALIHDPEIIILDEPTSGLDPHQIVEIRALIKQLASGHTVILSTHILNEVEASADRIVIINQGRIVADGAIEKLRKQAKEAERVKIVVKGRVKELTGVLAHCDSVTSVSPGQEDGPLSTFTLFGKQAEKMQREVGMLAAEKNWELTELSPLPLSLEETFLALTEKSRQAN